MNPLTALSMEVFLLEIIGDADKGLTYRQSSLEEAWMMCSTESLLMWQDRQKMN